ncbi:vegetative incompatibility protein HET-E-1 [Dactylonectria estremocensis]|uniref:Vegetative incompatibility protein HET-E-1 n=1 Tax=Dactylonectria estremocensis TaxID=1079267 RepID=A0A9P9D303_9HYPO|nr:vegetative incompatibility protein HET-E-1 [Dactylonectria estremocensis]
MGIDPWVQATAMVGWTSWAATCAVVLGSALLYPTAVKIRRRRQKPRPDGIQVVSDPSGAKFEIVAVHGLGAHPEYTWMGEVPANKRLAHRLEKIHLLRDLLKSDFPDARILSFAHNSDWLIDAPVKTAQQISDRLLDQLAKHRSCRLRVPIAFIGHSFGGIIIKEALCKPGDGAREVVDSTCVIIFLGTPHLGSPVSRAGSIAAYLTGFLGSDMGLLLTMTSHQKQLSDSEERFIDCMKQKEDRRQKTGIVAFCETKPTYLLRWLSLGLIVSRDSARGSHAATLVTIDTDHSGLNKCHGRNDQLYRELQKQLRRLEPTTTPTLNGNQQFVVDKLGAVEGAAFDSHDNEHDPTCLAGTRRELLEQVYQWANDSARERIYWLQGKAGTGKSTIARTVAHYFATQDRLAASFFFKRGEGDRRNARRFFTTIAAQLVQRLPTVAKHVRHAIEATPDVAGKALGDQFEKLILKPLEAVHRGPSKAMTVVIDALDECDGDQDVKVIIYQLSRANRLPEAPLKFFVTSRFEPPIRLGLEDIHGKYIELPLHEIPKPEIERDIAAFLESRLEQIRRQFHLPLGWPSQKQLQKLVQMAVPLFISTATACRFIEDRRHRGGPKERLEKFLQCQTGSSSFNATYRPILDQMLGLDESGEEESIEDFKLLGFLHSVLDIPSERSAPIRLFHQSFRDYLIDLKGGANKFIVDERDAHEMLAARCLQLLSESCHLKEDICGLREPGKAREHVDLRTIDRYLPSEVQYACLHWVHHLKGSASKVKDDDPAHRFLRCHFINWLEALSLLGRLPESIKFIKELQSMVNSTNGAQVGAFLHDAERFTLFFRQVIDAAPLQVYSSGLVFAPAASIVRQTFETHLPSWIVNPPLSESDWSPCLQTLEGHSGWVTSVAFSADGQRVASGSDDRTVKIWDAATGVCVQTLQGGSGVRSVAFSADGQRVASGSWDNTVKIWDAGTGACVRTLEGHGDSVFSIWDAGTGAYVQTLEHHGGVNSVAFSADSQRVASGSYDNTIKIWDTNTGACVQKVEGHSGSVNSVAFSADSRWIASGSWDNTVKIWDAGTVACVRTLEGHGDSVFSVAFSTDGQWIASGSLDKSDDYLSPIY